MARRLIHQVAIGAISPLWDSCIASVAAYAKRHGLDHHVQTEPLLRIVPKKTARSESALRLGFLPIFEKFTSFAALCDYDEILVLDADVYATPTAPNLFELVDEDIEFAAVVERDMPLSFDYERKVKNYARAQFNDPDFPYYNMGVRLIRQPLLRHLNGQSVTDFIHRPEFAKYVNGEGPHRWATEQVLLNVWIRGAGVIHAPLAWPWNTLYGAVRPSYVKEAKFVHFFLSSLLPSGATIESLLAHPEAVSRR